MPHDPTRTGEPAGRGNVKPKSCFGLRRETAQRQPPLQSRMFVNQPRCLPRDARLLPEGSVGIRSPRAASRWTLALLVGLMACSGANCPQFGAQLFPAAAPRIADNAFAAASHRRGERQQSPSAVALQHARFGLDARLSLVAGQPGVSTEPQLPFAPRRRSPVRKSIWEATTSSSGSGFVAASRRHCTSAATTSMPRAPPGSSFPSIRNGSSRPWAS